MPGPVAQYVAAMERYEREFEEQIRAEADEPSVRGLPIAGYDFAALVHQQRLELVDSHTQRLENGFANTDPDSWATRAEYRDALAFVDEIGNAVRSGHSISYQDVIHLSSDPESDASDVAAHAGAVARIAPLIRDLEATDYRFIEAPVAEQTVHYPVELDTAIRWEIKEEIGEQQGFGMSL